MKSDAGGIPLEISPPLHILSLVGHKRRPSAYQKQIRFLTILFAVIMILILVGLILLLNRPVGGYFHH